MFFGWAVLMTTGWAASTDLFENRIRPVLVDRCLECHSVKAEKLRGGLLLDSREGWQKGGASGPAIIPGKPAESLLVQVLRGKAHDVKPMPPKGGPLSETEIAAFEEWILAGAEDPRVGTAAVKAADPTRNHWAFLPPVMPAHPKLKKADWVRTGIDAYILSALEGKGLVPSPEADRRTLIRRVTLDLTGVPPTPEEMGAFLADRRAGAYERVVDRLLGSAAYGERWARHWLDVARYADSKGYVFEEERRYAYSHTYRDWVVAALNRDLPYDRFLIEQIAGDQMATDEDRTPLAAMGFLTLGRRFLNNPHDIIDDRIDVVTRGLMGLTVQCSRCHDHKFDPIPTADYYSLYGIFSNSREPEEKPFIAANPDPVRSAEFAKEKEKRQKELSDYRMERTAEVMKKLRERVGDYLLAAHDSASLDWTNLEGLARQRSLDPGLVAAWKGRLEQWRTQSHPVFAPWFAFEKLTPEEFGRRAPELVGSVTGGNLDGKPLNPRLAAHFKGFTPTSFTNVAAHYGELLTGVERNWRGTLEAAKSAGQPEPTQLAVADEEQLRLVLYGPDSPVQEVRNGIDRFFDTPVAQKLRALQRKIDELEATHPGAPLRAMAMLDREAISEPVVFKRGNPGNPGPKVPRRQLTVVAGQDSPAFEKGSGRLEFARSIVSRGNPLTARVFVNRVWQRHFGTALVRTPSDFGVRSDPPTHPELLDYLAVRFMDNGWSIKNLHRELLLSATYRQSSDPLAHGASKVEVAQAEKEDPANNLYWRMNRKRIDFEAMRDSLLAVSGTLDRTVGGRPVEIYDTDKPANRRTLYGFIDRQNLPGILRSFDFASPDATSPGRFQTSVPQQALFWLNSPVVADQARAMVNRPDIASRSGADRIRRLYDVAYQRSPDRGELDAAMRFVDGQGSDETPVSPASAWQYGRGHFDSASNRVDEFLQFRVFRDGRWQDAEKFPAMSPAAYASLTRTGGHPGVDGRHAAIRRWTAPSDMTVRISGTVSHSAKLGDGIHALVVSSRQGKLGAWEVSGTSASAEIGSVSVKRGETLDFVADPRSGDNSDSFEWAPEVVQVDGDRRAWAANADFSGAREWPRPLGPWQRLAQVLLASNEFNFVD
jgi:hypothetical protein